MQKRSSMRGWDSLYNTQEYASINQINTITNTKPVMEKSQHQIYGSQTPDIWKSNTRYMEVKHQIYESQTPDIWKSNTRYMEVKHRIYGSQTPDIWKKATITPILKPGKDKHNPLSYRPISLTSTFSKLLQKMIKARLCNYLECNNLISKYLAGCRVFL